MCISLRKHLLAVWYLLIIAYFCVKIIYNLISKFIVNLPPEKFTPKNGGLKKNINCWGYLAWGGGVMIKDKG